MPWIQQADRMQPLALWRREHEHEHQHGREHERALLARPVRSGCSERKKRRSTVRQLGAEHVDDEPLLQLPS